MPEHEDRKDELSTEPGIADTVRSELHTFAASRDRVIRRINVLVHDSEMPLVAVSFSPVLLYPAYQVPGR